MRASRELHGGSVDALQRELPSPEACQALVVLDLSAVTFYAVAGAQALARWRDQVEAGGRQVLLRGPQRAVLRVLEVVGFRTWLIEPENDGGRVWPHGDAQALTELLSATMERALQITGAPMGSAQLFEAEDETLRLVAHRGFGDRFVDYFATVSGPATSCGAAARDMRPVFVDNVLTSPVFAGAERDELLRAGVWAVASLPVLAADGTLLGVFSTHYPRIYNWTPKHRSTLLGIGQYAATA